MLNKLLIANRGEIACRIIRTARRMGLATVAVYSDADAEALHVEQADEAVHIGPSPATESYLRGDKIIAAAKATGAEAIHPGYGFLSENADFADAVTKAGLKFIGPSAGAMRALGGKAAAKDIALKAGVPVVPGYQGDKQDVRTLAAEARQVGYPVMIKAVAGGGGRGMRLVPSEAELPELLASAQREAESAFGDGRVLIEKVVERPRHIEVQVFGDSHGDVVHLFERDCTLQRRNQKVVEEAPAPGMSPELREKMCAAAVTLAKSVGYEGAGTVEFLVEGAGTDGRLGPEARWYFIEMNTRLQVEHPVTEEITGLDLVEWQLRVASGEKLPLSQDRITMTGHAIEVRLCAEDPAKGFLPSVGQIYGLDVGYGEEGCRLETGFGAGSVVPPFYDSMIAKLIRRGETREQALAALVRDLEATRVLGVKTNVAFLHALLTRDDVRRGSMSTGLIGAELSSLVGGEIAPAAVLEATRMLLDARHLAATPARGQDPWTATDGFVLGPERRTTYGVMVDGSRRSVAARWIGDTLTLSQDGTSRHWRLDEYGQWARTEGEDAHFGMAQAEGRVFATWGMQHAVVEWPAWDPASVEDGAAGGTIRAPINGKVARVFVAEGDAVEKGARIAVVEAMKMEHVLHAARAGTIAKVAAKEGQQVTQGALIASLAE
jgi:3-methylcrotonyl-CoA carboxylase alpha subunit